MSDLDSVLGDVDVLDATDTVLGGVYDFADARLVKAGWNYDMSGMTFIVTDPCPERPLFGDGFE